MMHKTRFIHGLCFIFTFIIPLNATAQTKVVTDNISAQKAIDQSLQDTEHKLLDALEKRFDDTRSRNEGIKEFSESIKHIPAGQQEILKEKAKKLLDEDKQVIKSVTPEIVKHYQRIDLKDKEIVEAVSSLWCRLRIGPDPKTVKFDGKEFMVFIRRWCYTLVESRPPDAKVCVDEAEFGQTTAHKYLWEGKHVFKLDKEGYPSHVEEKTVVPDKVNHFVFVLKTQPSQPKESTAIKKLK